ncbi:MAG: endonuclease/exonuclease/phosphatase family protein [Clostridia bacterium]|nr:endonuclease/exonuclease/phosphatase family protein [Clostridia bacterium]MBP3554506.1 endonuclease/exonuclease/phosphatase family protein [Clostridia bacterium]MBQ8419747.1 endonuclease/exonuclease/phosphatase family protein [Clostridia bacterium]
MSIAKIVTFNSRNVWMWSKEGINCFIFRAGLIYEKVNKEKPDVIAFQEILQKNLDLLKKLFPEYEFYGQFRNEDYTGEGLYTAVRKDAWDVIGYETFWISPTPYVSGSRFEDQSECPRICVVTQIRHKETGKMLRLYNIHLDHISDAARIEGIKCVMAKVKEFNAKLPLPSMIMGDYNALPDSETIRFCNEHQDPVIKDTTADLTITYHGYGTDSQKIDYIYVTEDMADAVLETNIWDTKYNGIYLSDHYPVCADVELDKL